VTDHLEQLCHWALSDVPHSAGLAETQVQPDLSDLAGSVRGVDCVMRTRVFTGATWRRWLVAVIRTDDGRPASLTAIGFPASSQRPILGIDLIGFGGRLPLVAIDALPVLGADDALARTCAGELQTLRTALADWVVDRRRPEFATVGFSPDALIMGSRPGHESSVLHVLANALPALYASVCNASPTGHTDEDGACAAAIVHWIAAERQNRREHDALARIFGEHAAERYLAEVLLPASEIQGNE
jgi:hypothetical protein